MNCLKRTGFIQGCTTADAKKDIEAEASISFFIWDLDIRLSGACKP